MDHFIGPLVLLSKSYIMDSTHLINIPNELNVQPMILLCDLDVTNLYTNIPSNEGIQTIKEMLAVHRYPHDLPHSRYIVDLLTVVLTNTYFEFNGTYYHQVSGTAMRTSWHTHIPICLWPNLRENMYKHILCNPYYGRDSLMISSWYGLMGFNYFISLLTT